MARFIRATTTQARSVPSRQSSRAQYRHAAIIVASRPAAIGFDAWPSIAACKPAEATASAAHARLPKVDADVTYVETRPGTVFHPSAACSPRILTVSARISTLRTLPVMVIGNSSTTWT